MTLTARQRQALDLIRREPLIGPRRVAGEFAIRSQDAGRILAALERRGLIEFHVGEHRAGYRAR